jgi:chemotaxis signal transduction protein
MGMGIGPSRTSPRIAGSAVPGGYVFCTVNGDEYGLEMRRVQAIVRLADDYVLPPLPRPSQPDSQQCRFAQVGGTWLPTINLSALLVRQASPRLSQGRLLVIRSARNDAQAVAALLVEVVGEVLDVQPEDCNVDPEGYQLPQSVHLVPHRLIKGFCRTAGGFRPLLDVDRIIAESLPHYARQAPGPKDGWWCRGLSVAPLPARAAG